MEWLRTEGGGERRVVGEVGGIVGSDAKTQALPHQILRPKE